MANLIRLIVSAFTGVGMFEVGKVVVDAVAEREHTPIMRGLQDKSSRFMTTSFWISTGLLTAAATVVLVAKLTKAQRKKLL